MVLHMQGPGILTLAGLSICVVFAPRVAFGQADHTLGPKYFERALKRRHLQLELLAERNVELLKKEYFDTHGRVLTDEVLEAAIQDARDRSGERWSKNFKPKLTRKIPGLEEFYVAPPEEQEHRASIFDIEGREGMKDKDDSSASADRPGIRRGSSTREGRDEVGGDGSGGSGSSSHQRRAQSLFVAFQELVLVSGASPGWPWNQGRNEYWCVGIPDLLLITPPPTSAPSPVPSSSPSNMPSVIPTLHPSNVPSNIPSKSTFPSPAPTSVPSSHPSNEPSPAPTQIPSSLPSSRPSQSLLPSNMPSPASNQTESSRRRLDATGAILYDRTEMTLLNCSSANRRAIVLDYNNENELEMVGVDGIYDDWCLEVPNSEKGSRVSVDVCDMTDPWQQWWLVKDDNTWRPNIWNNHPDGMFTGPYDMCVQAYPNTAAVGGGGTLKLNYCATKLGFGVESSHYGELYPDARRPQIFIACAKAVVCKPNPDSIGAFGCEEIDDCDVSYA